MTLKTLPTTETDTTVRDQPTSEGPLVTGAPSGDNGVSVTVSDSAGCVLLGGQVPTPTRDEHTGGHDEQ